MHFVQPATTMLPVLISSSFFPKWKTSEVRQLPRITQPEFIQEYKCLSAANSSFIIKSENQDGELPTEWSGQEEKEKGTTT